MYRHEEGRHGKIEGMRAIAVPVRERVMKLYEKGKSTAEIAESL